MKKITLILGTVALFSLGSIMLNSCGNDNQNTEEAHEHAENHEHHDGDGVDGDHHEHEEHGEEGHSHEHGGGHMKHMNDVKAWLEGELGDSYNEEVPPATAKQLEMGKKTFMTICATCHGMTGKGDGVAAAGLASKPADFTDPEHAGYYSDKGRIHIIKNGIEGTPMVGWSSSLSEEEIQAVYVYVRSLRKVEEADDHDHGDGMYTCTMHPEISGNKGDECPKCGMTLVLKEHDHDGDGHDHTH